MTPAHEASAFAVIDPVYAVENINPPSQILEGTRYWHYAPGELEAFFLQQMRQLTKLAKLKVGYPGFFRTPSTAIQFSRSFRAGEKVVFQASGSAAVQMGNREDHDFQEIARFENSNEYHRFRVPADAVITIVLNTDENNIPALGSDLDWDFSYGFGGDPNCDVHPKNTADIPPHQLDLPLVELQAEPCKELEGCYDLGREVLAYLELEASEKPELCAGESIPEIFCENPDDLEQSAELDEIAPGRYRSRTLLAMRYFRFCGSTPESFRVLAVFTPVQYAGAYA